MDEDATQDGKVNCSSFNYARHNDDVHKILDVEPSTPSFEPQFREKSRYQHDKNGNRIKDSDGKETKFEVSKEVSKQYYNIDWEKRVINFEARCSHGKTNRT